MTKPHTANDDHGFRASWQHAWSIPAFRWQLLLTAICLPACLRTLAAFLNRVEERPGIILPDPGLALFTPIDVNWLSFAIIYGGLFIGIAVLLRHPRHLVLAMQTYIVMVIFRIIAMSLVPLEPPATTIDLRDPVVQIFGTGRMLTKDLFFSGHTATLFLVGLSMPTTRLRLLYYVAAVAVAGCVLAQHAHYSIDVFAAPFFAYGAYRIVALHHERLGLQGTD
jgi:hypothetical protein